MATRTLRIRPDAGLVTVPQRIGPRGRMVGHTVEVGPDGLDLVLSERDFLTIPARLLGTIDEGALFEDVTVTLPPVLAKFSLLLRASTFTGETGDDWPNEGSGGSALDALCGGTVDGIEAGTPVFSDTPIPGFQTADGSSGDPSSGPFYSIPHSPLLNPGTGSFTVFAWITIQYDGSGVFANICSKIETPPAMGSGGTGWQLVNSGFTGGAALLISSGGSVGDIPVGVNLAASGAVMTEDTHLFVARVDIDTGDLNVFLDGVKSADADASQLGNVTADHELIFGRGDNPYIAHGFGYAPEALSDTEITVDLPAALEGS